MQVVIRINFDAMLLKKHIAIILAAIWCLGYAPLNAQTGVELDREGRRLHSAGSYDAALDKFYAARDAFEKTDEDANYLRTYWMILECLHKRSEIRQLNSELDSLASRVRMLEVTQEELLTNSHVVELFRYLVYKEEGDLHSALELLQANLDSLKATEDKGRINQVRKFKVYTYMAETYLDQGSYSRAVARANEAVLIGRPYGDELIVDGMLLRPHRVLAEAYRRVGMTDEAIRELNTISRQLPQVRERSIERTVRNYLMLAQLHLDNGALDSAAVFIDLASGLDREDQHRLEISSMRAKSYAASAQYVLAKRELRTLRDRLVEIIGPEGYEVAMLNAELGDIALLEGNPEALMWFHQALVAMSDGFTADDPSQNPDAQQLFDQVALVRIILGKSLAQYDRHVASDNPEHLEESWRTVCLAVGFVEKMRKGYIAPEDKSTLIEQSYRVFEHALQLCHTFDTRGAQGEWLDSAFIMMEKSKALNLMDAVAHQSARKFAGIPGELLDEELALRAEITGVKRQIRELRSTHQGEDTLLRNAIARLDDKERQHNELIGQFESDYPDYYRLMYGERSESIADIRSVLKSDEMVAEYYYGPSHSFLLTITKGEVMLLPLGNSMAIEHLIVDYRNGVQAFLDDRSTHEINTAFLDASRKLYQILLPQAIKVSGRMLIVPDGPINYLSFASLLSADPVQYRDFRTQSYLLWDADVSYSYSAALLHRLRSAGSSGDGNSIIFAPEIDPSTGFEPLQYVTDEATAVQEVTGAQVLEGTTCTSDAVRGSMEALGPSAVMHFATHGYANVDNGADSYLQLAGDGDDDRLYAYDLYSMALDVDLVYLSACETGSGNLRSGEGIISLARAFFYAGARTLVTTQWSVSDRGAYEITRHFYSAIGSGERIDQAICESQRRHIEKLQAEDRHLAHPAYWAAHVAIGSSTAVFENALAPLWLGVIGCLSILVLIFFLNKNSKRG